ncbi:hypothetical protein B0H16DRAFT_1884813 [Mycena metata]|uniref:Uncharacterized protein n=1 Tax=Mycena metata TaxID=1033252 RepID=A0AAD7JAT5_9AGAR|nr:hypothetical protein B0H16DRAFT_1884813 [Mycena metata]
MFGEILILSSTATAPPNTNASDESFIAHHTSPLCGFYRQPRSRDSASKQPFNVAPENNYFSRQRRPFNNRCFNRTSSRFNPYGKEFVGR